MSARDVSNDDDLAGLGDTQLLSRLRADVRASGYDVVSLETWFGNDVFAALRAGVAVAAEQVQAHKRVTEVHRAPLITLIDVFVVGAPVDFAAITAALPTLTVQGACDLGILELVDEQHYRSRLSLTASGPWIVISDLDDHLRGTSAPSEHVMGVGGATHSLIDAIPHERVGSALDLGTGCGIIALELSRIAHRVTATDISSRALTFAAANLTLNEVTNVELRLGDLCEPVREHQFDLIVSNPPFVISPAREGEHYVYRTSGEPGDALLRRMLAEAPELLAADGTLVCLANWETQWGSGGPDESARSLVPSAGQTTSLWVIGRGKQTPLEYAQLWLRDGGLRETDPRYATELRLWIDDLRDRHVAHVEFGYLMVRNAPSTAHMRIETIPGVLGEGERFGDTWKRVFDDWLTVEDRTDDELLEHVYTRPAHIEEVRTMIPGTEDITSMSYVRRAGIERFDAVDTFTSAVLGACDGDLTAGQIAGALADLLEIDPNDARTEACAIVREYVARGMLEPHPVD